MKVSKEKAAQNRERILTAAARLFRERGLAGVGVDALTDAAGLTHGSLYSQFGSKERLAAEALDHALAVSSARLDEAATLADYATRYLSPDHRERRGDGCAIAALAGEMPRVEGAIRQRFTGAVRANAQRIARLMPDGDVSEDTALATMATMVGALMLARAVDDPELSARILAASRDAIAMGDGDGG
jgi:TetR/AcrR family transcriptional regulator, transcriptional repressor for nem operon